MLLFYGVAPVTVWMAGDSVLGGLLFLGSLATEPLLGLWYATWQNPGSMNP